MEDERRILKSLRDINNDILDRFDPRLAEKFNIKSVLTLVVENTFSEMRSGATDMPMQLEFDYRFSRAIKERLKRQCYTPFSYFTAPKSFYPHTFTSTDYKDLPKLRPPKSRKLSARQVNEMRNWRAMYGQSVPQKTVRNMTTKDNPGTLPINLYAANSPPVEPLDFSALGQAPAVPTPQRDRPVTLYEQGQIVCVRGHSSALFVIASLQEDTFVGTKRVRAKVYNQDPFNAIIFTEDTEKYLEVNNIMCVISNYKSSNDILELEEGDLILLLDQLQNTNELVTVTEAAELSAETETTNELQSEQARTRRSRGRKRRFEEDFFYYE